MWSMAEETTPKANKEYMCDASHWIFNAGLNDDEYSPEDLAMVKAAEKEGFKILKGTKYIKCKGLFDGNFTTFRARFDIDKICIKYELYPED